MFQAATDGSVVSSAPIPFLNHEGDLASTADFMGGDHGEEGRKGSGSAPPPRPPPPGQTPPAGGPKSALDDLNDSIRVAMGSPSRPPPPGSTSQVPSVVAGVPQPMMQSYQMSPQMYGSPMKFPPTAAGK